MEALGRHILLELRSCNPATLDDLPSIEAAMLRAAEEAGATVIGRIFHQFSPQGVTGVVAIAESHLSVHTWPEYGYAAVDIFTCGLNFSPRHAALSLIDALESQDPEITEVERGRITLPAEAAAPAAVR